MLRKQEKIIRKSFGAGIKDKGGIMRKLNITKEKYKDWLRLCFKRKVNDYEAADIEQFFSDCKVSTQKKIIDLIEKDNLERFEGDFKQFKSVCLYEFKRGSLNNDTLKILKKGERKKVGARW